MLGLLDGATQLKNAFGSAADDWLQTFGPYNEHRSDQQLPA